MARAPPMCQKETGDALKVRQHEPPGGVPGFASQTPVRLKASTHAATPFGPFGPSAWFGAEPF